MFSIDAFNILLSSNVSPIVLSTTIKAMSVFSNSFKATVEEYLSI